MPIDGILGHGLPQGPGSEPARLRAAAKQFEAVFLNQLFQTASASKIDDDPLFGGDNASQTWESLLHGRLAEDAAGKMGIAELVFKELSVQADIARSTKPKATL